MYYSSGNYEAFARPVKPEGVERKSAYIVGSGLAALTAACYLVRDGQMKGARVHILEKEPIPGGACDGYLYDGLGYVMRGGREMDNHFEVMWDLFRSIPSIETEGVSLSLIHIFTAGALAASGALGSISLLSGGAFTSTDSVNWNEPDAGADRKSVV